MINDLYKNWFAKLAKITSEMKKIIACGMFLTHFACYVLAIQYFFS